MKKMLTALLCVLLIVSMTATSLAATIVLRPGSRGTAVREVQLALNAQGYANLVVDGIYGKQTTEAVTLYQRNNGLKADGKAGPRTLKKLLGRTDLDNDPEKESPSDGVTLRKGATGPAVRTLQARLRALGYLKQPVDGTYGDTTVAAVRSFQKLNGLGVDGKAGPNTQDVLYSDNAVKFYVPTVYTTLRPGMSGDGVKKLQQKLVSVGYDVRVTGYYNAETQAAVADYQLRHGLAIDGIAGQKTQESMFGK